MLLLFTVSTIEHMLISNILELIMLYCRFQYSKSMTFLQNKKYIYKKMGVIFFFFLEKLLQNPWQKICHKYLELVWDKNLFAKYVTKFLGILV